MSSFIQGRADDWQLRPPRLEELPALRQIEMEAGERFRAVGMDLVADAPGLSLESLERAHGRGMLWVLSNRKGIAGFAMADLLDGHAHLDEVSVLRRFAGHGLGGRLIEHVCAWARDAGHSEITLTTFADVPWNRPYYERLDFQVLALHDAGPELRRRVEEELRRGLDPKSRVVMRRWL